MTTTSGGHHHGHGALATGAQEGPADLAPEAVTARAMAQVVELVEVGVLAEAEPTLPVSTGRSGVSCCAAARRATTPRRWRPRSPGGTGARRSGRAGRCRAAASAAPRRRGTGGGPPAAGGGPQLAQVAGVPQPGAGHRPGPVAVAGQQGHDHFAEGEQRRLGQDPEEVEPACSTSRRCAARGGVAAPAASRGARRPRPPATVSGRSATGHRLAVAHPGLGRHHDRSPATWLRQERSRSSPMATMPASNPSSSRHRSARMRMQPPGATKTSRTASCWPWSTSPSWIRSTTAPVLSQCMPDVQQDRRGRPS